MPSVLTRRSAGAGSTRSIAAMAVSDAELEQRVADGTLAVDTRLRDALRTLRAPDGTYRAA